MAITQRALNSFLDNLLVRLTRGHWYGQYYIVFEYKGERHQIHFTESEVWDNYNDYDHPEKDREAKIWVYGRIKRYMEEQGL